MDFDNRHRKTPEEEELDKKIAEFSELEYDLTQLELELATLHGELRAFERRYISIIGKRYAELDEIEAQIAEAQARITPENKKSKGKATKVRVQAQESAQATEEISETLKQERFRPSESLKKLYREVAKNIHPDLSNDEEDRFRRQSLMAEANRAYEDGNEARLEAILREWEVSPESVKGNGIGAELVRTIRKITQVRERLSVIKAEIDLLRKSELHQMKAKIEKAEDKGRDLLREMAAQLDGKIATAKQKLKKIKLEEERWA